MRGKDELPGGHVNYVHRGELSRVYSVNVATGAIILSCQCLIDFHIAYCLYTKMLQSIEDSISQHVQNMVNVYWLFGRKG